MGTSEKREIAPHRAGVHRVHCAGARIPELRENDPTDAPFGADQPAGAVPKKKECGPTT